jgi:hypothetical protein
MENRPFFKTIVKLISPLLLFVILVIPYGWLNSNLLVDIFGCGCPKVDEFGNIIHPDFNANDFTALFWLSISLCVGVISTVLSIKMIPKNKLWFRILYVIIMLVLSLFITYNLYLAMMWN